MAATQVSDFWVRIGDSDFRQVLGRHGCNGETVFYVTPSRLGAAAQVRAQRLAEARAAGLSPVR